MSEPINIRSMYATGTGTRCCAVAGKGRKIAFLPPMSRPAENATQICLEPQGGCRPILRLERIVLASRWLYHPGPQSFSDELLDASSFKHPPEPDSRLLDFPPRDPQHTSEIVCAACIAVTPY
jgi:hypothetical protein